MIQDTIPLLILFLGVVLFCTGAFMSFGLVGGVLITGIILMIIGFVGVTL